MSKLIYFGRLYVGEWGETDRALFLSTVDGPFVERLSEELNGKRVSVRYWVSDVERSPKEIKDSFIYMLYGGTDAAFYPRYSETTGYLYTVEDLQVGGHDLAAEFYSHEGKWLLLEIEVE